MTIELKDIELIGREEESLRIRACLSVGRNVLLEGPVGVGKTHLAIRVAESLEQKIYRIDGDSRYTEQKLSGWFDPPLVMKKGFAKETFVAGPLVEAMQSGGVLFLNELNRLPEGVQNVLLPAIDERRILIPKLGEVRAKPSFRVIATQNPKEFVATSHLSEAILDRFELITLDYQQEAEEKKIVQVNLEIRRGGAFKADSAFLSKAIDFSVRLARMTRSHPRVRRGASIRAAIAIAEIALELFKGSRSIDEALVSAAILALPTRIEIEEERDGDLAPQKDLENLIRQLSEEALGKQLESGPKKKP